MKIDKYKSFKKEKLMDIPTTRSFVIELLDIFAYSDIDELSNFMNYINDEFHSKNVKQLLPLDYIKLSKEINKILYKHQIDSVFNYKIIKNIIDEFKIKVVEILNYEIDITIYDDGNSFRLELLIKLGNNANIKDYKELFGELEILEILINETKLKQDLEVSTLDGLGKDHIIKVYTKF